MTKLKKAPSAPKGQKIQKTSGVVKWGLGFLILALAIILISYFKSNNEASTVPVTSSTTYPFKKEGELAFISALGDTIQHVDVEVAESVAERNLGLMFRTQMTDKQGMIFLFEEETEQSFWMKNTYLSLDMMFINHENVIVKIQKNTEPLSTAPYNSEKPAQFVVEMIGGYSDKYGIKEGDKIRWRKL